MTVVIFWVGSEEEELSCVGSLSRPGKLCDPDWGWVADPSGLGRGGPSVVRW